MIDIEAAQRNGELRRKTSGVRRKAAEIYLQVFPNDSANVLSLKAAIGSILSSGISEYQNKLLKPGEILPRVPNLVFATLTALGDSIDGKAAEIIEERTGKKSVGGTELDTALDRVTTTVRVLARANSAHARGDILGETLAYAAGITGMMTSWARKLAASRNVVVEEEGSGVAVIGTHPVRTALGIISTSFPRLQPGLDAISITGDLINAGHRFRAAFSEDNGENLAEKRRLKILTAQTIAMAALMIGNFVSTRIDEKKGRVNS